MTDIQNFSVPKREPLKFQIDDDVFYAAPMIGADVLRDVLDMTDATALQSVDLEGATLEQRRAAASAASSQTAKTMAFLDQVLEEESALRFAERMRSTTEPITIEQAFRVWQWLIGEYGSRPTQPSSPSANGHDGTGTSSTAGAPVEA